jgi:hypothetical protein
VTENILNRVSGENQMVNTAKLKIIHTPNIKSMHNSDHNKYEK